jgi:uncharacterized protein
MLAFSRCAFRHLGRDRAPVNAAIRVISSRKRELLGYDARGDRRSNMTAYHGAFVWHELMTTDSAAARKFYGDVVGWNARRPENSPIPYWLLSAGETPAAGLMDQPEDARRRGEPPMWLGYVGVDDVDAATAKAQSLGGQVLLSPRDIPGVGRFCVIADPAGAAVAMMTWTNPMPEPLHAPNAPGFVGWNELMSNDAGRAFDFYAAMFGWTKDHAVDMGPMGVYQLFAHGGRAIGGMMNRPPQIPAAAWNFYFNTPDVDAAVERLRAAGGTVANGPMEVPGGDWIVQAIDPQGGFFALVGKRG